MTEELKQLREALRRVKYEAASLADAQVIALEALALPAQQATPEPGGEALQFPPMPEGWPARFRCDSCDGNGEIGELVSMGHFQPPERQTCPDCGGRGWTSEEHAFNADHMREFAEAHALLTRPAPGVPEEALAVAEHIRAKAATPEPVGEVELAFDQGWRMAAEWANRDDLIPDMDSPHYAKERSDRLASLPTQPAAQEMPDAVEHYGTVDDLPAAQATPKADPLNPGWCVGCNPDNCMGCGIGLNEAQATPEPSRGMIGMGAHALANELAQAVAQDDADPDGHDMSAGLFGPNVSAWLRKISADYLPQPATPEPVQPRTFDARNAQFREHNWQIRFDAAVDARRLAQERLYSERERHTAEVKRLQLEIGRLTATPEPVGEAPIWNSIQIASWIGSQLMHEPAMFERAAVCKFVRSLGRHATLLKHSPQANASNSSQP